MIIGIIAMVLVYLMGVCVGMSIGINIEYKRYEQIKKEEHERIEEIFRGGKHDD